jgi:hypothetical protein
VPLIDEIYDLTAHFPYRTGLRVNELAITPLQGVKPYTIRMMMTGTVQKADANLVQQFIDTVNSRNKPDHCRATLVSMRAAGTGEAEKAAEQFSVRIDIAPRPPENYVTKLEPGAAPTAGGGEPRTKGKFGFKRPGGGN